MVDLDRLKDKFPKGPREAFEDMCTQMFCTHLKLSEGVNRRVNQSGIESEPVTIGDKVYAYQAKYYDPATQLKDKKTDFISSIKIARNKGVTDLLLFVDKNLPDEVASRDGAAYEEPSWLREINKEADGGKDRPKVTLHWWSRSKIQDTLELERYRYIKPLFFAVDGKDGYAPFYSYACDQFYGDKGSVLYGNVPLSECYIEPTVKLGDKEPLSAREYIESCVDRKEPWANNGSISVICGEPGHGKTSLCRKAVCDFKKMGWLAGKVSNVFYFSLNPAGTEALDRDTLHFNSLLSWGDEDDRIEDDHIIKAEDCKNALVFLDGFDELLDSYPTDLEDFIKEPIIRFVQRTGAHVIITTRSMVIGPDKNEYGLRSTRGFDRESMCVPIARLQPITKEEQLGWIKQQIDRLSNLIKGNPEFPSQEYVDGVNKELEELRSYYKSYEQLSENIDLQDILGIPLIFRMVVAAHYKPKNGQSISCIYDDLFEAVWRRYKLLDFSPTSTETETMSAAKRWLSQHALRVFADDAGTAVVDNVLMSPWVFSYYTTRKNGDGGGSIIRVGFLHRSFYQYFLAHEVISWLEEYARDKNADLFQERLSHLACRRVDKTTLQFVLDLYAEHSSCEPLDDSFSMAYEILKETDGILPLSDEVANSNGIKGVSPVERANNIFWNVVSICSVCGHALTADEVNTRAVQLFDLEGCVLIKANLANADLNGARLSFANLKDANIKEARLRQAGLLLADLRGACLEQADLRMAELRYAHLEGAHLERAHLEQADLLMADLRYAHLEGAHLEQADLFSADLSLAHLEGAHLEQADLFSADLSLAHLEGAHLEQADLFEADLRNAHLEGVDLRYAKNIDGANFDGAYLDGALMPSKKKELSSST